MLRRLWAGWKRVGKKVADVQSRALLTLVYFTLIAPFALAVRWAADPLAIKPGTPRTWRPRPSEPEVTLDSARRQF
jgi:hypothetical protein